MSKPKVSVVLGIRPDVIRASLILQKLKSQQQIDFKFIWSGQHYSDNLKDIFFRELSIPKVDVELNSVGETDAEIASSIITNLYLELLADRPDAVVFLGDTNTVLGSIAAAQLNIPIVHIEGCMRSYDWRMPEEKCRTVIDHLSDVIYTYFPEYKLQGVAEGIPENKIVVIKNLIVDVLDNYYTPKRSEYEIKGKALASEMGIEGSFYLATAHRRENVEEKKTLSSIFDLFEKSGLPVIFPASYRTQKNIQKFALQLPENVKMIDPIGYFDMLALMSVSRAVITDSGTVVEETAVIGVPSIQMRKATERPQTYDCLSSVKHDPNVDQIANTLIKLETIVGTTWKHNLGDGKASDRLVNDLVTRLLSGKVGTHNREDYQVPTERSYQSDGIDL
jgi:UDP-N-acetylglucosamine 2-epimerase (non-hydrolysing)